MSAEPNSFSDGAKRMMYFFSAPVHIRQEIMDRIYIKSFGCGVEEFNARGAAITPFQQQHVAKLLTEELLSMDMAD